MTNVLTMPPITDKTGSELKFLDDCSSSTQHNVCVIVGSAGGTQLREIEKCKRHKVIDGEEKCSQRNNHLNDVFLKSCSVFCLGMGVGYIHTQI